MDSRSPFDSLGPVSPVAQNISSTEAAQKDIVPYRIHTSSRYLDLTKKKLELTRLPREAEVQGNREWELGTPKRVLDPLIDFWLEKYSWREQEQVLNDLLPQFRTTISLPGVPASRVHFVHKPSPNSKAIPLLFCHGWPGSFIEVSKIINELSDVRTIPTEGSPIQLNVHDISFHVVAPSIPGFGFSDPSGDPNFGLRATGDLFDVLMKQLGYDKYVAHGSDFGFQICRSLALFHPSSCIAIHTTNPLLPAPTLSGSPWQFLRYQAARLTSGRFTSLGYHPTDLHSTRTNTSESASTSAFALGDVSKDTADESPCELEFTHHPQTSAYSLCDSPSGLLACIIDFLHFQVASQIRTLGTAWTQTDVLNWTMLQWLPGPEAGLRWIRASRREMRTNWGRFSHVPLGISLFTGKTRANSLKESVSSSDVDLEGGNGAHVPGAEVSCSPPLWAASVQQLSWVKRHGRNYRRPHWEEPGEVAVDLKEFVGALVTQGWMRRSQRRFAAN